MISALGNFTLGVLTAPFLAFIQLPVAVYLLYILSIPFGGLRIWTYGWASLRNVLRFSRALAILLGAVFVLVGTSPDSNLSLPFSVGFLSAAIAIQIGFSESVSKQW